jgi:hypothetical protein
MRFVEKEHAMAVKPFDPMNAPVARNTASDKAAMMAELNKVILKLREAGVQLQGQFKWRMTGEPYWNPVGFDFMCDDWQRLHDAAAKSSRLGFDIIDMPGTDPWLRAGIQSVGFTQIGKPPFIHLDIAVNRPGLCRIYILTQARERRIDNLKRAKVVTARDTDVFKEIYKRVLAIGLDLDLHIGSHLEAGRSRLEGINFVAKNHQLLMDGLTALTYPGGAKVFAPGSKLMAGHLPLQLSYKATEGTGFRQIWYAPRPDQPVGQPAADMDARFSAHFGDSRNLPDLSSIHCAISPTLCNIHIDEMGFVLADEKGNAIVDPDALRHILVELLWKTNLQGKLPFWALDRINFDIASSPLAFSRMGIGVDVKQSKRLKVSLRGSCAVDGAMECSGTVTVGRGF